MPITCLSLQCGVSETSSVSNMFFDVPVVPKCHFIFWKINGSRNGLEFSSTVFFFFNESVLDCANFIKYSGRTNCTKQKKWKFTYGKEKKLRDYLGQYFCAEQGPGIGLLLYLCAERQCREFTVLENYLISLFPNLPCHQQQEGVNSFSRCLPGCVAIAVHQSLSDVGSMCSYDVQQARFFQMLLEYLQSTRRWNNVL